MERILDGNVTEGKRKIERTKRAEGRKCCVEKQEERKINGFYFARAKVERGGRKDKR